MSETPEQAAARLASLAPPPLAAAAPLPAEPPHDGAPLVSATGAKLATAMFLHHFALGSWIVTLGSYVGANTIGSGSGIFAAGFVGTVYGAGPLGGMVSPFLTGLLADRFFATERLMAALSLMCAVALYIAAAAQSQAVFYVALIAYFLFYLPSFALATSMSMHHLSRPERDFPVVRACGTMGWIAGGVFVGWFWPLVTGEFIETTVTPMLIGVVGQVVAAAFCLVLPHTPPAGGRLDPALEGLSSSQTLDLVRHPRFVGLMALAVFAHIPAQFYYAYGNVFFNWAGMSSAAAKMTIGQAFEVGFMLLMPALLMRVTVKSLIMVGLTAWVVRFCVLAAGADPQAWGRDALLYLAIALHGLAFTFVTISLQLEVDRAAGRRRRATAQGLLSVAIQGFGCFVGAELAGMTGARWLPADVAVATPGAWRTFWILPACGAAAVWIFAALLLPRERATVGGIQARNTD